MVPILPVGAVELRGFVFGSVPMTRGLEYEPLATVPGTHQRLRKAQPNSW